MMQGWVSLHKPLLNARMEWDNVNKLVSVRESQHQKEAVQC